MAAPKECGHCAPTFTIKDLVLKEIKSDPRIVEPSPSLGPSIGSGGAMLWILVLEYEACLKDIKCISNSTTLPRPDRGAGRLRLPKFRNGNILNINSGKGIDVTIPPETSVMTGGLFSTATGATYGEDFTYEVCCKKDHPVDCCGLMKDALCDHIKRLYAAHPDLAQFEECCWLGQFQFIMRGFSGDPFDDTQSGALDAHLEMLKPLIARDIVLHLAYKMRDLLAVSGYSPFIYGADDVQRKLRRFDPHPEDPIIGQWNEACLCLPNPADTTIYDKCP